MRVAQAINDAGEVIGHRIFCPACRCTHLFNAPNQPNSGGHKWTFDGNLEAPSFSPSMNATSNPKDHPGHNQDLPTTRCHFFVRAGSIDYCTDSTHHLAGKTVALPEIPHEWLRG